MRLFKITTKIYPEVEIFSKKKIITKIINIKTVKKQTSIKSDSSDDSDVEEEEAPKDKYLSGQCLLKFKK